MCSDHAADLDRALAHGLLRKGTGVVLQEHFQRRSAQAGISKENGKLTVNVVFLNHLQERFAPLPGPSGFAQHRNHAVPHAQNRLDAEYPAGQRGGFGDAPALFQILQCIEQAENASALTQLLQLCCKLRSAGTGVDPSQSILRQNPCAEGDGAAVHHEHLAWKIGCGNVGALIRPGYL